MKKLFYTFVCLLLFSLSPQAQNIVSCVPNWGSPGSNITVTVTGTAIDFTMVTTYAVELQSPQGVVTTHYVTSTTPTVLTADVSIPTNAVLGDYNMRLPNSNMVWQAGEFSVLSGPPGSTGLVSGHVYDDLNNNCVQDGAEGDRPTQIVEIFPGPYYAATNSNGDYYAQLAPGNYTLAPALQLHEVQTCNTVPITATLPAIGQTVTAPDIGIMMSHVTDGGVYCSTMPVRPGFDQWHTVGVTNHGYYPLTGEVRYILDNQYTYLNSVPSGTVSGDTVIWTISPPIPQGGSRNFEVQTNCPIPTPLGTILQCRALLLLDSADANGYDNSSNCQEIVVGSYDPNDKMVWNQDMEAADPVIHPGDSMLIYRIRFQNTGTASAINIVVRDTISSNLDLSTFRNLSSSHGPPAFDLSGDGKIQWSFPNINLPDSNSNEPESHGYIMYSIKLKPGVGLGQSIENTASIYFDFNAPVVTNTTQSSIVVRIIDPTEFNPIVVYPNPTMQTLFVRTNCEGRGVMTMRLIDPMGKTLRTALSVCSSGVTEITVDDLPAGIYFLSGTLGNASWVKKVVILD